MDRRSFFKALAAIAIPGSVTGSSNRWNRNRWPPDDLGDTRRHLFIDSPNGSSTEVIGMLDFSITVDNLSHDNAIPWRRVRSNTYSILVADRRLPTPVNSADLPWTRALAG